MPRRPANDNALRRTSCHAPPLALPPATAARLQEAFALHHAPASPQMQVLALTGSVRRRPNPAPARARHAEPRPHLSA